MFLIVCFDRMEFDVKIYKNPLFFMFDFINKNNVQITCTIFNLVFNKRFCYKINDKIYYFPILLLLNTEKINIADIKNKINYLPIFDINFNQKNNVILTKLNVLTKCIINVSEYLNYAEQLLREINNNKTYSEEELKEIDKIKKLCEKYNIVYPNDIDFIPCLRKLKFNSNDVKHNIVSIGYVDKEDNILIIKDNKIVLYYDIV